MYVLFGPFGMSIRLRHTVPPVEVASCTGEFSKFSALSARGTRLRDAPGRRCSGSSQTVPALDGVMLCIWVCGFPATISPGRRRVLCTRMSWTTNQAAEHNPRQGLVSLATNRLCSTSIRRCLLCHNDLRCNAKSEKPSAPNRLFEATFVRHYATARPGRTTTHWFDRAITK